MHTDGTVQHTPALTCLLRPFSPRHSQSRTDVLTAAFAAALLMFWRSAHLSVRKRILMRA